jgi:dTDP-4-dehydrorhamnose reductase
VKVLITGHKGQLGMDLMRCAQIRGVDAVGAGRSRCDITSVDSIERFFAHEGPFDTVINTAAYTAVDRAESDPETAYAVNRDGAGHLAGACARRGTPLIHISTDYVFGGLRAEPCKPTDSIAPMGVYACSKAAGEDAVRRSLDRHIILRVSWLFGRFGNNFVKTMLRLAREKETLQVVDDQIGSPTYAGDLAEALLLICERLAGQDPSSWGTHHYCNQGALTWYAFARKIISFARAFEKLTVREVTPILTASYPTPAPRPLYSVLDCGTFDQAFGIERRAWWEGLKEMLEALYADQGSE